MNQLGLKLRKKWCKRGIRRNFLSWGIQKYFESICSRLISIVQLSNSLATTMPKLLYKLKCFQENFRFFYNFAHIFYILR